MRVINLLISLFSIIKTKAFECVSVAKFHLKISLNHC